MPQGKRRQGREIALQFLYGLRDRPENAEIQVGGFLDHFRTSYDPIDDYFRPREEPLSEEARQFAEILCKGVVSHLEKIDRTLVEISANWSLERMARVDLALLRLATYELLFCPEIPTSVVLNEAIEIGKRFGTKETPAFVNGILDKVAKSYRK